MASKALTMKLLVDTNSNKVLFAEAGKDVVDILFSLLAMPVSSVVKLLTNDRMVGCIASLYGSLEGLDATYLQSEHSKEALLNPEVAAPFLSSHKPQLPPPYPAKKFYMCSHQPNNNFMSVDRYYNTCINMTDVNGVTCPTHNSGISREMKYIDPPNPNPNKKVVVEEVNAGYVKGVVTYSIMDDLTVTPMSTISSITLLNKLHVTDVGALREKTVEIGYKEGVELVKSSLQSKTVLTDVFLAKAQPQVSRKTVKPEPDVR